MSGTGRSEDSVIFSFHLKFFHGKASAKIMAVNAWPAVRAVPKKKKK